MGLFSNFSKKYVFRDKIKFFYEHPEMLVEIEFSNRTEQKKKVWVEPTCVEFELDALTEYKIVTHDKCLRMEFDKDDFIVFYLEHSFGFKLYKRPISIDIINSNEWILEEDLSVIN